MYGRPSGDNLDSKCLLKLIDLDDFMKSWQTQGLSNIKGKAVPEKGKKQQLRSQGPSNPTNDIF